MQNTQIVSQTCCTHGKNVLVLANALSHGRLECLGANILHMIMQYKYIEERSPWPTRPNFSLKPYKGNKCENIKHNSNCDIAKSISKFQPTQEITTIYILWKGRGWVVVW